MLTQHPTSPSLAFASALAQFGRELLGRNFSGSSITAYTTDVRQFTEWLAETTITVETPGQVKRADLSEYLSYLADCSRSGLTRRRKLASLREFFRFLVSQGQLRESPAAGMQLPKKEVKERVYLRVDEFQQLIKAAGGEPRDTAILAVLLQTGIRVSELCNLTLVDVDLTNKSLTIRQAKGKKDRVIPLEPKGREALKRYLQYRPDSLSSSLFLSYQGRGLSDRSVQKLIEKYRKRAGIAKKISCHSLRHTFGAYKASQGVSPFQLQQWFGHQSIVTTQIYTHMGKEHGRKVMEQTSLPI